jgi:hypothetical protein
MCTKLGMVLRVHPHEEEVKRRGTPGVEEDQREQNGDHDLSSELAVRHGYLCRSYMSV